MTAEELARELFKIFSIEHKDEPMDLSMLGLSEGYAPERFRDIANYLLENYCLISKKAIAMGQTHSDMITTGNTWSSGLSPETTAKYFPKSCKEE